MILINEVKKMKKIIKILLIFMLVLTAVAPLSVFAGDPENPEITDDKDDIVINKSRLLNILITLHILDSKSLNFLDINSAWFFENPTESEYLFVSLKLEQLDFPNQRVIYSLYWTCNNFEMSAYVHITSNGEHALFAVKNDQWGASYKINGSFDVDLDTVTFKIPKTMVGDPQPGAIIENPSAWAGLRTNRESLFTVIFFGELALDFTGVGKNYIIQY